MSATPAYITVEEVTTMSIQLPRTVHTDSDPETVECCMRHYFRIARNSMEHNGHIFPYSTLQLVAEAMVDGGAVTVLYTNEKGEISARTIFPHSLTLTGDHHVTTWGYCTLRRELRSFRLDKMRCVQLVTTPAEAAQVAAA